MRQAALVSRIIAIVLTATLGSASAARNAETGLAKIEHVVVIYAENRSFDHLYGMFPGAEGIANATAEQKMQLDFDGRPLPHLPPVYTPQGAPDPKFPRALPNGPFRIDAPPVDRRLDEALPDPIHVYYRHREQIANGKNNMFVAMSNVGAWVMGYLDGSKMKLWRWAKEFTLADHFFQAAYGGSFLNHHWLICACTPTFPNAPESMVPKLDERGNLRKRPSSPKSVLDGPVRVFDGRVSPDGFAVHSVQPPYQPSGVPPAAGGNVELADPKQFPLPPQNAKTIGDTLSAKGVSWAWYAGAWSAGLADGRRAPGEPRRVIYGRTPDAPVFIPHHHPFNYFARYAPGTENRARYLRDGADLFRDIEKGTLPQVAFYKPEGRYDQHPSSAGGIAGGDAHVADVLERLRKSPQWPKMAVIVTYDENGGFWDHVPPPSGPGWSDRWGPGTRIPTLIISPYAKRGYVDKTPYDTTSIIKFITRRFALEPLPGVRANAGDLTNAFEFGR
ncbi:MAG: acid phosphatase [Betaproteobacteria bacterium]|nr:acid phosphatase [Betaproteobacteria bacterium]